jgi:MFS family permease
MYSRVYQESESKFRGYLSVIGGIVLGLFSGCMYLWANIFIYIVTHFHYLHTPHASTDQAASLVTLIIIFGSIANLFGPYFQKRFHPKLILALLGTSMLLSVLIASLTTSWSVFVFFYIIWFPVASAISYWIPLMCAWEWFPERRGLVTGVIVSGFGLGPFIFGFLTTYIVNPENYPT